MGWTWGFVDSSKDWSKVVTSVDVAKLIIVGMVIIE